MRWVTVAIALGCVHLSPAPTPTPTSTHTPLVDGSDEELDEPCMEPCTCEVKEGVLQVHCDARGFTNASQVSQSWVRPFKLNLQRNSLRRLYSNSFLHLGNAVALNLGSNALQDVRVGAFHGLARLRRLYLHENKLDVFRNDTFLGLEALEYLQADYNVIKRIDSGALRFLYKLRVLILNDNLIPVLPAHLFRSVSLTHLDLRGNRLKTLAYAGTLEYVGRSLMELQLEENPWACGCEAVPLQRWLGRIPYTAVVGDVTCEHPFHLHGKDLREIPRRELCGQLPDKEEPLRGNDGGGDDGGGEAGVDSRPNPRPGRARPTRPSSMVHGSRQNTHTSSTASSTSSASSSAERRERERHPRPTKRPRPSRTPPTPRSLQPNQNPPVAGYQTRPPIPIVCPLGCTCSLHITDLGLTVNCKEAGFVNVSQLAPRPLNGRKLYLGGNLIQRVYRADFWNFSGLELLHLGNNRISYLQEGAFSSLAGLRSLYLNGNNLERLGPDMFLGLQNLRYLYFEYNEIREVAPGTLDPMPSLQLLFLNANLLQSLPPGLFSRVRLSRLNLRNNHFLHLPVEGVLEHLTGLVKVDLQQNPWECGCSATPLKRWLEGLSAVVVVGEVVCHGPGEADGADLRSLSPDRLCPELVAGPFPGSPDRQTPTATTGSSNTAAAATAPEPGGPAPAAGRDSIPLSVLVLSLLVLLVAVFFAAAALVAYALRRRGDKLPFRRQGEAGLVGIHMECGIFAEQAHHHQHHLHHHHHQHGLPGTPAPAPPEHTHVYDTIQAPTGSRSSPGKDDLTPPEPAAAAAARFSPTPPTRGADAGYRSAGDGEREWALEVSSAPIGIVAGATSAGLLAGLPPHGNGVLCPTVIDSQGPTPTVEPVGCLFRIPGPDLRQLPGRYARPPPRYPHPALPGKPGGVPGVASSIQGPLRDLPAAVTAARLRATPDYMEVLDRSYQF